MPAYNPISSNVEVLSASLCSASMQWKEHPDRHYPFRPELRAAEAENCSIMSTGAVIARFGTLALQPDLHLRWRRGYGRDRYCEYLTADELNARFKDILVNMTTLTPEAKLGMPGMDQAGGILWQRMTHVLEEFQLRYGSNPNGIKLGLMKDTSLPAFATELAQRAARIGSKTFIGAGKILVKYGDSKYLTSLHKEGRILVRSASFYSRPDLNGAVRDDERVLQVAFAARPETVRKLARNPQDMPADYQGQRMDFRLQTQRDYWILCFSSRLDPRLFLDFRADSCLIIKDPEEFIQRIRTVSQKYFPEATVRSGAVNYIDPVLPSRAAFDVELAKHFRYEYQSEYRFVWRPKAHSHALPDTDIEIGSLSDITELITL